VRIPPFIRARPTLVSMTVLGLVVLAAQPSSWPLVTRCLIAWCVATFLFVIVVSWRMTGRGRAQLEHSAAELDTSALVILTLAGLAAAASFVAVVAELAGMQSVPLGPRNLHLVLTLATVVCSWFFVQTMFAIHYTHVYYAGGRKNRPPLDFGSPGGADEPHDPDYWDFVYFTVSIGATSQTSDTAVRTRLMRRIVTAHAIYAFFFNTTVLALLINIAAGLLGT
jgi:uncharacterized membrane protein